MLVESLFYNWTFLLENMVSPFLVLAKQSLGRVCLFNEMVYNDVCVTWRWWWWWEKKFTSFWCPKISMVYYSIELICLNGCLGSYLKLNGKFQFNSLIHCWAFCLKKKKKKKQLIMETIPGSNLISCITCRVMLLGWIAMNRGKNTYIYHLLANSGLTDIRRGVEKHTNQLR